MDALTSIPSDKLVTNVLQQYLLDNGVPAAAVQQVTAGMILETVRDQQESILDQAKGHSDETAGISAVIQTPESMHDDLQSASDTSPPLQRPASPPSMIASLTPSSSAICNDPPAGYFTFLGGDVHMLPFIAMRLAAVCVALSRWNRPGEAKVLGQWSVDFLGAAIWQTAVAAYERESAEGDNLMASKMALADCIDQIAVLFDEEIARELQDVALSCEMLYMCPAG